MNRARFVFCHAILLFLPVLHPLFAAEWKAGLAAVSITPKGPLWMAGFGDRKRPSEGVAQELWAKALVLEDQRGRRAALVGTDMLGFPAAVGEAIAKRVRESYGIPRERLLLNSSHTHCGPVVEHMQAAPTYAMQPEDFAHTAAYTRELEDKVVAVIGEAIRNLAPARLGFGKTLASFGIHRRMPGGIRWGPNYAGPVDHDVPVLRVEGTDGALRGIVFGYGAHPSTIGPWLHKFHGDYAGSAQKWLQDRHPGTVALFVMGCGGDVKPYPNDTIELADAYGAVLGAAVEKCMQDGLRPVNGELTAAYETVPLQFGTPPTRDQLNRELNAGGPAARRHAAAMLKVLDRDGHLPASYPYPVQAWQFGRDLTLVAMGGEVVSEYALRLKNELGADALWLAGYSNDVFAYIPSRRILEEGGYEGGGAMVFYVQPGPWAASVEETVVGAVHGIVQRVRGK